MALFLSRKIWRQTDGPENTTLDEKILRSSTRAQAHTENGKGMKRDAVVCGYFGWPFCRAVVSDEFNRILMIQELKWRIQSGFGIELPGDTSSVRVIRAIIKYGKIGVVIA